MTRPDDDKRDRLEAANEELIRGMTEMATRFSTAMDGAKAQIHRLEAQNKRLREVLERTLNAWQVDMSDEFDKEDFEEWKTVKLARAALLETE